MNKETSSITQPKSVDLSMKDKGLSDDIGFSNHLLNLPGLLGEIQDYVYGTMIYPTRAGAGIAALITLSMLHQKTVTIDHFGGISLNWLTVILAPTGFGKEIIVKGISKVYEDASKPRKISFKPNQQTQIKYQIPASPQKLHTVLEANNSTAFFSDEFAEWLAQTKNNSYRQETIGYIMQAYSKSIGGKVTPPESIGNNYKPVENPRISVIATTTGLRLMETLTTSQGDSGAYNRMMILPLEQEIPKKRYEGQVYEISKNLSDSLEKLSFDERVLKLSEEAKIKWEELDRNFFESLKRQDSVLAGRLAEQCVSLAGVICLSRFSTVISEDDITKAADIRLNMYHRTKAFLEEHGGIQNATPIVNAAEQVYKLLQNNGTMTLGLLSDRSRQYGKLDVRDRNEVHKYLKETYGCTVGKSGRGYPQISLPDTEDG